MRDPAYYGLALATVGDIVTIPFQLGHYFVLTQRSQTGTTVAPTGLIVWASLTVDTEAKVASTLAEPAHLAASQYGEGDRLWILELAGDPKLVGEAIERLRRSEWQGRDVSVRLRQPQGPAIVRKFPAVYHAT